MEKQRCKTCTRTYSRGGSYHTPLKQLYIRTGSDSRFITIDKMICPDCKTIYDTKKRKN